jgi:hypothetical protein
MAAGFGWAPVCLASTTTSTAKTCWSVALMVRTFTIEADPANTGTLYVGASDVTSTKALRLSAGEAVKFENINQGLMPIMYDLQAFWVKASGGTQSYSITYVREQG